jgi:hypothetical protein
LNSLQTAHKNQKPTLQKNEKWVYKAKKNSLFLAALAGVLTCKEVLCQQGRRCLYQQVVLLWARSTNSIKLIPHVILYKINEKC